MSISLIMCELYTVYSKSCYINSVLIPETRVSIRSTTAIGTLIIRPVKLVLGRSNTLGAWFNHVKEHAMHNAARPQVLRGGGRC